MSISRLTAKLEEIGLRTYRRGVSYINDPLLEFSTSSSEFKVHHINYSKGQSSKSSGVVVSINKKDSCLSRLAIS